MHKNPLARFVSRPLHSALPIFLLLLCGLSLGCTPVEADGFLLGGIQVNEPELEPWLDALEEEGMNTISVTDYAKQGDWDSDHLWWDETDNILNEVRNAKERGMKAVLILRVALDQAFEKNRFLWHGMIMPRSDEQVHSWFDQYTRFVLRWAEIAEREKVDVLMIASEMNALASTIPLSELPPLEEYYLNEEKQKERKAQTLAYKRMIEEKHLSQPGREQYDSLEEYLDARIAIEENWAVQTTLDDSSAENKTNTTEDGVTEDAAAEDATAEDSDVLADARALARINARRMLLEERWRRLISDVRQVYSGRLGYAANFDQYRLVTFWDALDVMGINAYFQVRRLFLPEEERQSERLYPLLEGGWATVLDDIATFRRKNDLAEMPVIFSELGYTYRANSTLNPWADTGFGLIEPPAGSEGEKQVVVWRDQPDDPTERALAIRALHNAHAQLNSPLLEGLLYWKLSTVPSHREIESFVLILGEEEDDPMLDELRRFRDLGTTSSKR